MKIHSYFIVSVLGLAMLNSCTDLAETPYTFVSPDTFYQNEKQLDEALMTEYSALPEIGKISCVWKVAQNLHNHRVALKITTRTLMIGIM